MSAIFNQAKAYCQAGCQAAKQAVSHGIQYASENPEACAKVAAYAISALATIGTIALVGTAIASFAAAAIFPGTITVCFAVFVGVIAHDSFRIAKNLETQDWKSRAAGGSLLETGAAMAKARAAQAKGFLQKVNPFRQAEVAREEETPFVNAILKRTLISKIPGVKGFVGAIHTELSKA